MPRRAAVMGRLLIPVVVCLAIASPALAIELVWSTGAKDISVPESAPCTLLVRTTVVFESLPREWRVTWVASGGGSSPIAVQQNQPVLGYADVCTLNAAASLAGLAARVDTALHCGVSAAREPVARYIVQVEGGVQARFKLVPVLDPKTGLVPPGGVDSLEVTVNGGVDLPYPPGPMTMHSSLVADGLKVTVAGFDLDGVTSVTYHGPSSTIPLEIVEKSPSSLMAISNVGQMPAAGFLELRNDQGFTGAIELPGSVPAPWVPDRFLVRFRAGEVEPPTGRTSGSLLQFQYRSSELLDSLVTVGVLRLERLLPWFEHTDVNSVDLLGQPVVLEDLADLYVAHVVPGTDIRLVSLRVDQLAGVRYACPDWILRTTAPPPSDPYFGEQWWLSNTGQQPCGYPGLSGRDMGALSAWDFETGTPTTRVGILDTGILAAHPELAPRVVLDTSFVNSSASDDSPGRHGTAVAGIIGAATNNVTGVAGVARGVSLWAIKVCHAAEGGCPSSAVIDGLDRARMQGISIVNMSLAGPSEYFCPAGQNCIAAVAPLNQACFNAFQAGLFLVASSGNIPIRYYDFEDQIHPVWPAAYHRRVFAVGAVLNTGARWFDSDISPIFCGDPTNAALYCRASNYGSIDGRPWLDAVAPGGRFIVTTRDTSAANRYHLLTNCNINNLSNTAFGGTSAAAPMVAGLAALLKSERPNLTGEDFEQIIIRTTVAPAGGYDAPVGFGRIQAGAALQSIVSPARVLRDSLRAAAQQLAVVESMLVTSRRFLDVSGLPANDYTTSAVRYKLRGSRILSPAYTQSPWVWIRGAGSLGWRDTTTYDQKYEVPGGEVVSVSTDSVVLETNVYRIRDNQDTTITLGWYPTTPDRARLGYTLVGYGGPVGVDDSGVTASAFSIGVRPNPTRRQAWIDFTIPRAGPVTVEVFDLAGRRVATLVRASLPEGRHSVSWDGGDGSAGAMGAGIYYVRCGFGRREIVRRLAVLGLRR